MYQFFELENRIFLGDCLDRLSFFPAKCIDCIACDLPYQVTQNEWDSLINLEQLWIEYKRIIKDNGVIVLTATQPFASQLISSNPKMFKYDLIWVKNKSSGHLNAKRMPLRQHESILVFYNKPPTYNPQKSTGHEPVHAYTKHVDSSNYGATQYGFSGGGSTERHPTSVLQFKVLNNDAPERFHPTQKPVELFEWIIQTYTNEGDLVLDSCI